MKISYVNGICLSNDAISNAIRDEILWLNEFHDVKLYTYACDNPALPQMIVNDARDIIFDAHFQASDMVIFHFGVFYPLFNVITATPKGAQRMVVFHNITPKKFVNPSGHHLIDSSFAQLANMHWADHIICVSKTNSNVLRQSGIDKPVTVMPLALHTSVQAPLAKPSFHDQTVRFVFVGRFVRSKGPVELLDALAEVMAARPRLHARLDLVGSLTFSDQQLLEDIRAAIGSLESRFGARLQIMLRGSAPEAEKNQCLAEADIMVLPSYHEGFCVPILEALASGCKIIAYDNSNIPDITGNLGQLVPTGDKPALAGAMLTAADAVGEPEWHSADSTGSDSGYTAHARQAFAYVSAFTPRLTRFRFLNLLRRLTPAFAWNK